MEENGHYVGQQRRFTLSQSVCYRLHPLLAMLSQFQLSQHDMSVTLSVPIRNAL